jgi:hypothetical protein
MPATSPRQFALANSLRKHIESITRFHLQPAILILLLYWLFRNGFHTVQRIVDYYTPLPTWDYWRIVLNLNEYRSFHLGILWTQHNEHRIVFPELFFAADMLLLHGRLILPLIVSFLCYLATFLMLSSPIYLDRYLTKFERFTAIALAGVLVFWEGCANVLASPFLLQWTMMQFTTACSFVFLSRMKNTKSSVPLLGTAIAATIATYSSGNALVLWPLIISLALFLRLGKTQLFVLSSSAVINFAFYFVNYRSSSSLNLRNFWVHPVYSFNYIASYLSMPFGGKGAPSFGIAAGLLSLVGTATLFLLAVRKQVHTSPPAIVLFGYYVFTSLTALVTAAGRMDPQDSQFIAAKASRYVTVPQMHWGVVILLCLWIAWRTLHPKQIDNVLALGVAILLFVYLPKLAPWLGATADLFAEQQLETLSVEDGLTDKNLLLKICPSLPAVSAGLSSLQQSNLSIYYHFRGRWLGQPVHLFSPIRNSMPGAITQATSVDSGLQVLGWADFSEWESPYRWVIMTDESGAIVGFGSHFPAGFPRSVRSPTNPSPFGWVGFISQRRRPKTVFAYIVSPRRNEIFPLTGSLPLPQESHE